MFNRVLDAPVRMYIRFDAAAHELVIRGGSMKLRRFAQDRQPGRVLSRRYSDVIEGTFLYVSVKWLPGDRTGSPHCSPDRHVECLTKANTCTSWRPHTTLTPAYNSPHYTYTGSARLSRRSTSVSVEVRPTSRLIIAVHLSALCRLPLLTGDEAENESDYQP